MKAILIGVGIVIGAAAAGLATIDTDKLATDRCKERSAYLRGDAHRTFSSDVELQKAVRGNYEASCGWLHLFGWLEPPRPVQSGSGLNRQGGI